MKNEKEIQNDWQLENNATIQDANDFSNQKYYASDEDEDEEDEDDTEDTDDEERNSDWGNVDPLTHSGPPSDMDPSAPGSAV